MLVQANGQENVRLGGVYQGAWSFDFPHMKHRVIDGGAWRCFKQVACRNPDPHPISIQSPSDAANRTPAPPWHVPFCHLADFVSHTTVMERDPTDSCAISAAVGRSFCLLVLCCGRSFLLLAYPLLLTLYCLSESGMNEFPADSFRHGVNPEWRRFQTPRRSRSRFSNPSSHPSEPPPSRFPSLFRHLLVLCVHLLRLLHCNSCRRQCSLSLDHWPLSP
jgi:hypothetical protein